MNKYARNVELLGLLFFSVLNILSTPPTFSLTYQQDIGVNFTFNTALRLTLSSSDIHIYNLAPGTANDSNIINVNVLTNSVSGYTLNATVGNDTTYNTRNLVHTNSSISDNFTSIDYTDSPTITTNTNIDTDKWAFSFSTDNGTNWSNYNGLPLYSDTENIATLKETNGPVSSEAGDDIKFKIAAKASDTKPAGDYSNVINFTLVAAPAPISLLDAYAAAGKQQFNGYYKMQDMNSNICDLVEAVDEQLQVIDVRDGKTYWIAKLQDGNCWMTQNLDHDIVTDNNFYTYDNTDIGHGGTIDVTATYAATTATYETNSSAWGSNFVESYDPGDLCWDETIFPSGSNIYNDTLKNCSNTHYHIGNYYNFPAATALDFSITPTNNEDFNRSICPAGWMLPKSSVTTTGSGSIDYLSTEADLIPGVVGNIHQAPFYLVYGGYYYTSISNDGYMGGYWSSTYGYNDVAYGLIMYGSNLSVTGSNESMYTGYSIRCLAR